MKYKLDKELRVRYSKFLNSKEFKNIPEYSKSEYWKFHASEVKILLKQDYIKAKGKSGFYHPSK